MNALVRYDTTADAAARSVIRTYSTSFGMAVRLLGRRHRQHVRNIYAMVRVADEIVDGVPTESGLDEQAQRESLERYADETHRAMRVGYSSDLIVHAFARTARACAIDDRLTEPFFSSMRADLGSTPARPRMFDAVEHAQYVHGSAEVVGLMCLRVFLRGETVAPQVLAALEEGARQLGAAFQNVNFLRDLADDTERLGRSYLDEDGPLDDEGRLAWLRTVRTQLSVADRAIPLLPRDTRAAVRTALSLFAAVADRVERTPAADLYRRRIRVPDPVKAVLTARACATAWVERSA